MIEHKLFLYAFILPDHSKSRMSHQGEVFQLISLPDTVFEQTLGFLSFHEVSLLRRVSKKCNETCMRLLNQGFRNAEKFHGKCLKVTNQSLLKFEVNILLDAFLGSESQIAQEGVRAKEPQALASLWHLDCDWDKNIPSEHDLPQVRRH